MDTTISITLIDAIVRIFAAMVLGMLLGTERIMAGKTAGMRTYALVSTGAAFFIVLSMLVTEMYRGVLSVDPLRVISQVIVGIGFIGAGLIIFRDSRVSGLTTAAGLWVAAGIGAASGFGFYYLAAFVSLMTLLVFTVLWHIERKIKTASEAYSNRHKGFDDDEY